MLIDFHTHLHSYSNLDETLQQIIENQILSVGCAVDSESYAITRQMAAKTEWVLPTFGIHPMCSDRVTHLPDLDPLLEQSKLIGEIGLDDYWFKDIPLSTQERVFEYILDHCHRFNKYCVIHTKGAEQRIADLLRNYPQARPIIHWYSGPRDIFHTYLERGYPCTFGCEVAYSEDIRILLRDTPLDLLLAETDNPTSEPWLGGTDDSPLLIRRVIADLAAVKGLDFASMNNRLNLNSQKIFMESDIRVPGLKVV